jgi:hypothetical protein
MKRDTELAERVLSFFYALEVQYLIENRMMDELQDVQEAYDIPEEKAIEILEAVCGRYIDQLLNLALRSAKNYEEKECVKWTKEIMKYIPFISTSVAADGNNFSEEDKNRLISFYLTEIEATATLEGEEAEVKEGLLPSTDLSKDEVATRLRELIALSTTYQGPGLGIDGLLGDVKNLEDLGRETVSNKKSWAWG